LDLVLESHQTVDDDSLQALEKRYVAPKHALGGVDVGVAEKNGNEVVWTETKTWAAAG
jgi:hypothetical protein